LRLTDGGWRGRAARAGQEKAFLTADQSDALVTALMDPEHELPILVGLYCGLRPTEYLALQWRDLDGGGLRVMQTLHRVRAQRETTHKGQPVVGFQAESQGGARAAGPFDGQPDARHL
jgi:integrase